MESNLQTFLCESTWLVAWPGITSSRSIDYGKTLFQYHNFSKKYIIFVITYCAVSRFALHWPWKHLKYQETICGGAWCPPQPFVMEEVVAFLIPKWGFHVQQFGCVKFSFSHLISTQELQTTNNDKSKNVLSPPKIASLKRIFIMGNDVMTLRPVVLAPRG